MALAADAGLSGAQLAVLWCKDQPGITAPIIGTRTQQDLDELLPVMEMTLSDDLRAACDELVPPGNAVANFHNTADWMKSSIDGVGYEPMPRAPGSTYPAPSGPMAPDRSRWAQHSVIETHYMAVGNALWAQVVANSSHKNASF